MGIESKIKDALNDAAVSEIRNILDRMNRDEVMRDIRINIETEIENWAGTHIHDLIHDAVDELDLDL